MNSMFQGSPFGGSVFGSNGPGNGAGFGRAPALGMVRLAQDATATTPAPDVSGLTGGIEDLLKQLPPDVLGNYNTKYQACQTQLSTGGAVGLVAGGKCLADLYKEIQNFIKNGPPKPPIAPAAGADIILPVVVGVLGISALIWGLSKL